MRAISIETLAGLRGVPNQDAATIRTLDWLINVHCHELQEPWMTLDEFLKSGFVGKCWVYSEDIVLETEYDTNGFWYVFKYIDDNKITRVIPIHKPEPPR